MRHVVGRAVVVCMILAGGLLLGACSRLTCPTGCEVAVAEEQTVELPFSQSDVRDLTIVLIEPDAVTVELDGQQARVPKGQRGTVGSVEVEVKSVKGRNIVLEARSLQPVHG